MADYTTAADLTARFDARSIQQLVSDTGTPVLPSELTTDVKLIAALDDAEGEVTANLLVGGRYTTTELAALTGTALAYLKYIICNIAMLHLLGRRPAINAKLYEQLKELRETHLKALQDGHAIFGGNDEDADAGRTSVDGISYQDMVNNDSIRIRKPRYFATPSIPIGRR
jgi:phage gp36-like protein